MSKSGFFNPLDKNKPKAGKSPFDFKAPSYDERSSCFISAGEHHGVGHKNPVGHDGNAKMHVDALPYGRVNTMRIDEKG